MIPLLPHSTAILTTLTVPSTCTSTAGGFLGVALLDLDVATAELVIVPGQRLHHALKVREGHEGDACEGVDITQNKSLATQ